MSGESRLPWSQHDASASQIVLTEVLAEVSLEALEGDSLETILQSMADCIARRMPVTIASIILLNDEATHFVQEFWSGRVDLELPGGMPW
ncbi:MAG: hypothetical protein L0H70_05425, partial [Xanthomonadales bacterium]|nr:hypothetical protein [Xanthomonadales bacterium]